MIIIPVIYRTMHMGGIPGVTKPHFSVSLSQRTYDFVLWARKKNEFPTSKSAIVEHALIQMANRMGYYTETDKEYLAKELQRLERSLPGRHPIDVI